MPRGAPCHWLLCSLSSLLYNNVVEFEEKIKSKISCRTNSHILNLAAILKWHSQAIRLDTPCRILYAPWQTHNHQKRIAKMPHYPKAKLHKHTQKSSLYNNFTLEAIHKSQQELWIHNPGFNKQKFTLHIPVLLVFDSQSLPSSGNLIYSPASLTTRLNSLL